MAGSNYFDAVIIGLDPAGLLAAGRLARQGSRVLVVGQGGSRDFYRLEEREVPASVGWLPPRGHSPWLDELLVELNLEDAVRPLGEPARPALQLITPRERLDLDSQDPQRETELRRAFGADAERLSGALQRIQALHRDFCAQLGEIDELPPAGLWSRFWLRRRQQARAVELPPADEFPFALRMLMWGNDFLSRLPAAGRSPGLEAHLAAAQLGGLRLVERIRMHLITALEKLGVDCREKAAVERMRFDGRRIAEIQLLSDRGRYPVGTALFNLPIGPCAKLLPLERRHRRFSSLAETVRPSQSIFGIDLILPRKALPLGLGALALVQAPEAPQGREGLLRVQLADFDEKSQRVRVNLSRLVPTLERARGNEYLGTVQKEMLSAAAWIIPFLADHPQVRSSPYWTSLAPAEDPASPWEIDSVIDTEHEIFPGGSVLPVRTVYPNVFFTGPEVLPGMGIGGAALAARQAARCVGEIAGRHPRP
jgi:hypothetical protein